MSSYITNALNSTQRGACLTLIPTPVNCSTSGTESWESSSSPWSVSPFFITNWAWPWGASFLNISLKYLETYNQKLNKWRINSILLLITILLDLRRILKILSLQQSPFHTCLNVSWIASYFLWSNEFIRSRIDCKIRWKLTELLSTCTQVNLHQQYLIHCIFLIKYTQKLMKVHRHHIKLAVVNIPRYLMSTVQFLLPFNQLFLLVREIDKLIQGLFVHMAIPFQFLVAILKFFEEL